MRRHLGNQTALALLSWLPHPSTSLSFSSQANPVREQSPMKQNQVWSHGPVYPLGAPFLNGASEPG